MSAIREPRAYVTGATWNWPWSWHASDITATAFVEVAIGRWTTTDHAVSASTWTTQLGLTPVLRLQSARIARDWFAELGVGPNVIIPLYRSGYKHFSTAFTFGDHFGIGRSFGQHRRNELVLRAEHFSNAGIKHPNPGENFLQLRYARRF